MTDYDDFAEAYAVENEQGFFNAWYARPEVLRLLGDVEGRRVLDVGCGSGPVMATLGRAGAEVTGFDASAAMVRLHRPLDAVTAAGFHVTTLSEPPPVAATPAELLPPGLGEEQRFIGFLFLALVAVRGGNPR